MSTNFYMRAPACGTCQQPMAPDLHLGKRSMGWPFTHVGNRGVDFDRPRVEGFLDWRQMIEDHLRLGWVIEDEYGESWTALELLTEVARLRENVRRAHDGEGFWVDEDGNWFCELEFC